MVPSPDIHLELSTFSITARRVCGNLKLLIIFCSGICQAKRYSCSRALLYRCDLRGACLRSDELITPRVCVTVAMVVVSCTYADVYMYAYTHAHTDICAHVYKPGAYQGNNAYGSEKWFWSRKGTESFYALMTTNANEEG